MATTQITRAAAVEILQQGRAAIGKLASRIPLNAAQIALMANLDRALESGLALAETVPSESDGLLVLRNTARLVARHLFDATKDTLPDSRERDGLIEWQAGFALLSYGQTMPAPSAQARN